VNRTNVQTERHPPNSGDVDAFVRSLYAEHSSSLRGLVLPMLRDWQQAEDVVQETMLRAWRNYDTLSSERGPIGGWLAKVARNIAIDRLRAKRRRPPEIQDEPVPGEMRLSVADHSDQVVNSVLVARALAVLTSEQHAVIQQVYFADRTCAEAAVVLDIPLGTVKSRLHYALRNLRHALDDQPSQPNRPA
jgi:RNA polymerase sigma-70 factor (ECF subfamily)